MAGLTDLVSDLGDKMVCNVEKSVSETSTPDIEVVCTRGGNVETEDPIASTPAVEFDYVSVEIPEAQDPINEGQPQTSNSRSESESKTTPPTTPPEVETKIEPTDAPKPIVKCKREPALCPTKFTSARERQILVAYYIKLFTKRFSRFPDPQGSMQAINEHAVQVADENHYPDLDQFHHDYLVMYMERVTHSAETEFYVRRKLEKFSWGAWHWWAKCLRLPRQMRRMEMVRMVVRELGSRGFKNKAFQDKVDEFCRP
jgi:hypothetical protein